METNKSKQLKQSYIGKKIDGSMLTIIEFIGKDNTGRTLCLCKCECGNLTKTRFSAVTSKTTKSCGCLRSIKMKENCVLGHQLRDYHGLTNNKLHKVWEGMTQRCYLKTHTSYKNYGGRGISVCEEWLGKEGFVNFYNWAINNGYKEEKLPNGKNKLTIDRIDVNGNYQPSNCRWITHKEQCSNKRKNVYVISNTGEKYSIYDLIRQYNLISPTAYLWARKGYSYEKIMSKIEQLKQERDKNNVSVP